MSCEHHKNLSAYIKNVHKKLREDCKTLGEEKAWTKHIQNKDDLQKYSAAMQSVATKYWEDNMQHNDNNRILWTVNYCINYWHNGDQNILNTQRERELRILKTMQEDVPTMFLEPPDQIKLLDVGSCYNPFSKFKQFDVTAIDIAPAAQSNVIECDFLACNVDNSDEELFQSGSFDTIVFSLLLEYMPTSAQRKKCCQNAYEILRTEGLLIIITPDSKHVGANAKLMKNWRYTLSLMGFSRVKIEKLQHITCMVFRKAVNKKLTLRWAKIHKEEYMTDEIHIPQDFNKDENDC